MEKMKSYINNDVWAYITAVIFVLLHNLIYYLNGISLCFFSFPLLFWGIFRFMKILKYNGPMFGIYVISCFFVFAIENIIEYPYALENKGIVYSSTIKELHVGRHGSYILAKMLDGSSEEVKVWRASSNHMASDTILFAYPQLAYEKKWFFFSSFLSHEYEKNPTRPQIDYCINGAVYSDKVRYLKKHSGKIKKDDIRNYWSRIKKHDNRIISAALEKRGNRYIYANPFQSEDKLWALNYREVNNGARVLIVYDIQQPSLFTVINWNPSEDEYEYYNTKEGKKPSDKYLCIMDIISKRFTD